MDCDTTLCLVGVFFSFVRQIFFFSYLVLYNIFNILLLCCCFCCCWFFAAAAAFYYYDRQEDYFAPQVFLFQTAHNFDFPVSLGNFGNDGLAGLHHSFAWNRLLFPVTILLVVTGVLSVFRNTSRHRKNKYEFDLKKHYFRKLSLDKILSTERYSSSKELVDAVIIRGISEGAAANLNNCELKLSSTLPSIGGKPHFEGTVIVQTRHTKEVPSALEYSWKDPHWYITLDDVIKYDQSGNNITPVVAYTKVGLQSSVPWKEKVTWNVHVAGAKRLGESLIL